MLDLQLNPLIRSRLLSTPTVQAISAMLDRETKQEKNLELRERDLRRAREKAKDSSDKESAEEKESWLAVLIEARLHTRDAIARR